MKKLEGHIRRAKRGVFEGAKRPRKKGGSGGPPPENFYEWYANGANLGISGKFDLLLYSLAVAYFREHKNKIEWKSSKIDYIKSICSSTCADMEMRLMTHKKKEMHESKFLLLNKENVCMHGKSLSNIFQYIF